MSSHPEAQGGALLSVGRGYRSQPTSAQARSGLGKARPRGRMACEAALAAASSEPPFPSRYPHARAAQRPPGCRASLPTWQDEKDTEALCQRRAGRLRADSNVTLREMRNSVRGRGAYFYNKVDRSVFIPPDIQVGTDAVVSPRWNVLSSSTRDVCNARRPDRREKTGLIFR